MWVMAWPPPPPKPLPPLLWALAKWGPDEDDELETRPLEDLVREELDKMRHTLDGHTAALAADAQEMTAGIEGILAKLERGERPAPPLPPKDPELSDIMSKFSIRLKGMKA